MPGDNGEPEAGGEGADVVVAAPRVMENPIPGLHPFDTTDEPNSLWLKWKKWIRSFNLYLAAKGMDSDGQKVALLLYIGGMKLQEIFYQIVPENAQLTFDQTV